MKGGLWLIILHYRSDKAHVKSGLSSLPYLVCYKEIIGLD